MKIGKNETGRTILETLSVLAIMGILSIVGIIIYRIALDKQRAAEVVDNLNKRATVLSSQLQLNQEPSLKGFDNKASIYDLVVEEDGNSFLLNKENNTFSMTVQSVSKGVCEKIFDLKWEIPRISPETCEDNTDMLFTFNNDLVYWGG